MYSLILVPIDDSATARCGMDEAILLAQRLGSTLRFLNVVDARFLIAEVSAYMPPEQLLAGWRAAGETLLLAAAGAARAKGVTSTSVVRCDPGLRVCDAIVKEASESGAQLIVMGTHGRHGLRRLALGSDAELVLRDSPVPVLLVRGVDPARTQGPT